MLVAMVRVKIGAADCLFAYWGPNVPTNVIFTLLFSVFVVSVYFCSSVLCPQPFVSFV